MNELKRARVALEVLDKRYGWGDDEWTEAYRAVARVVAILAGTSLSRNRVLVEHLVTWLEWAAELRPRRPPVVLTEEERWET